MKNNLDYIVIVICFSFITICNGQNQSIQDKLSEIDRIMYAHQGHKAIPIIDSLLNTNISIQNTSILKSYKIEALVQVSEYEKALFLSEKLLKNKKTLGVSLIRTHIERALIFEINGLYKEAEKSLNFVNNYYEDSTIEKDELYGEYLYRSSSLYKILGDLEKALKLAYDAKKFGKIHKYKNIEATASTLLLDILTKNHTLTSKFEFQLRKRLLYLWKQTYHHDQIGYAYIGFSYYYLDQKDYKKANKYLDSAYSIGTASKNWVTISYTFHSKYNLFKMQGNFKKALINYKKYKEASDSLKIVESSKKIAEINGKYNYEKEILKNNTLEQNLKSEIKEKNNLFIGLITLFILLCIFGYLGIKIGKKRKEIKKQSQIIKDKNIKLLEALDENKLLLKELNHRVNNNIALILSLVKFQYYEIDDPKYKEKFQSLEHRIKTIAAAHEQLLYDRENLDGENYDVQEYLSKITNALLEISIKNVQVNLEIRNIKLNIDTMLPIGILINELMSNSLKHAIFENELIIEIQINLHQSEIEIMYKDSGTIFKETTKTKSLGVNIINSMVKQLKGSIQRKGSEYIISLQLKNSKKER